MATFHAATVHRIGSLALGSLLVISCAQPDATSATRFDSPRSSFPRCEVVNDDGSAELLGSVAYVDLVELPQGVMLLVRGDNGLQWYPLQDDGSLGPRAGRIERRDFYGGGMGLSVEPTSIGFRVWTLGGTIEVDTTANTLIERSYALDKLAPLTYPRVVRRFRASGQSFVIWVAGNPADAQRPVAAGLAIVDDITLSVAPVGQPYYQGPPQIGLAELAFTGGFDEASGYFFADSPDQSQVFTISLDGQLLGSQPISGDAPYLMHWIKMGNGGWAGGHMWGWIQFETTERHWLDPRRTYTIQGTFSSGAATHLRDSQGRVFIADGYQNHIHVRRYDESRAAANDPINTDIWTYVCSPAK